MQQTITINGKRYTAHQISKLMSQDNMTDDQTKQVAGLKMGMPKRSLGGDWQTGRLPNGTSVEAKIYGKPSRFDMKGARKTSKFYLKSKDGHVINYDHGWDSGTTANDKAYAAAIAKVMESKMVTR